MERVRHVREPRVVARCRIEFERLDRRVAAESEDLSRSGAFVRTEDLLPVGAITELDLTLPDGALFHVVARVVHLLSPSQARALGRHCGMGLEFLEADDGDLASYLDDLIDDLTPAPPPTAARVRVVVVEPGAPLRTRLTVALQAAGVVVESFADGATAFNACVAHPPDGVLSALAMPGTSGLDLLRAIAVHPRLSAVPVVLMSDDASDHTRLDAFRLGVRDFLIRPFLDEELVIRVRRAATLAPRAASPDGGATLRGDLAEISLGTLLSLLEFERKSGIVVVTAGARAARLFVATGRVVKLDGGRADRPARGRLMAVLDWAAGQFEFTGCEVVGADEIGLPTTQLLLEHARVRDEAGQLTRAG